ncbi:MAG: FAD-dependent oxidoreductase, partial [Planctomycetota bacterium]
MSRVAEHYDLIVVGGGIAGVASAELIARTAAARGRLARIVVLEAGPGIGCGASGSLQGWFHTGALYSTFDEDVSSNACVRSRRILDEQYGPASNFGLVRNVDRWFTDAVRYDIDAG